LLEPVFCGCHNHGLLGSCTRESGLPFVQRNYGKGARVHTSPIQVAARAPQVTLKSQIAVTSLGPPAPARAPVHAISHPSGGVLAGGCSISCSGCWRCCCCVWAWCYQACTPVRSWHRHWGINDTRCCRVSHSTPHGRWPASGHCAGRVAVPGGVGVEQHGPYGGGVSCCAAGSQAAGVCGCCQRGHVAVGQVC
jgi:hypothetical protein